MPNVYPNEEETSDGNGNSGDGSIQIVPIVVQPDRVEGSGTLMPQ